ncbi:MAG: hypothetical protein QG573_746 [Acidobacteriota bacterium]|nr:hypothetical protein [Acidobacteriota bacterium]
MSLPLRQRTFSWHDPAEIRARAQGKSGLEFLRAMLAGEIPPPPVAELVGVHLELVEPGRVVFVLAPAEFHLNPNSVLHGGIAALVCDTACGCAVISELPPGETCATLEIKVNYLRPVGVATARLECIGTVLHLGRRSALAEARLVDPRGKLVAHATSTLMLFPPEDPHGYPYG